MFVKKLPRFMLITASILIATGTASANLVTNPGFESTPLNSTVPPWVSGGAIGLDSFFPHTDTWAVSSTCDGAGCVTIGASGVGGTGAITQTIEDLQPGIYQLSYWLVNEGAGVHQFAASLGNNVVRNTSSVPTTGYLEAIHISAVSGGDTNLALAVRHDTGAFMDIDDVSLIMVDDGAGNNLGAASQTIAAQAAYGFLDRLQDRFGHSGSPVQVANAREAVYASSGNTGYMGGNGRYRAHISVYGDRGKWDSGDVTSHRSGISAGAELAVTDELDLGLSLAAGHGRFKTDTIFTDNRARSDEFLGALYGHWGPQSIPLYLTAAAGYGHSSNDFTRTSTMGLGAVTVRDVESMLTFASVEFGYDWKLSNSFILTPYARADGARIDQDGYAEIQLAGALLTPAVVAPVEVDAARTILGARGTIDMNVGRRGARLTASAGWAHEFERDRVVAFSATTPSLPSGTDVTFLGTASGATPAANSVVAGANIEAPVSDDARFFAGYNGSFASGQDIHAGEVGIRVVW